MVNPFSCSGDCSPVAPSHVLLVINIQIYSMSLLSLCFLYWASKQPRNPKPLSWQGSRQRLGRNTKCKRTHIHACTCTHTEKVLCYILFKNLKLEASFAAQFCHLIIWPGRSYYIFPSLFLIYLSCKVVMGMDRGYIEHSTETGCLYYWTRLCAYQGMNNFLTNLLFHY